MGPRPGAARPSPDAGVFLPLPECRVQEVPVCDHRAGAGGLAGRPGGLPRLVQAGAQEYLP